MYPFLKKLFADGGYQGPDFQKALAKILPQLETEIVKRMVRHAPIHRRSGHSDIAICCGRNVRGSSLSTSVVPLSNQVTTLNHKRQCRRRVEAEPAGGVECSLRSLIMKLVIPKDISFRIPCFVFWSSL